MPASCTSFSHSTCARHLTFDGCKGKRPSSRWTIVSERDTCRSPSVFRVVLCLYVQLGPGCKWNRRSGRGTGVMWTAGARLLGIISACAVWPPRHFRIKLVCEVRQSEWLVASPHIPPYDTHETYLQTKHITKCAETHTAAHVRVRNAPIYRAQRFTIYSCKNLDLWLALTLCFFT